MTPETVPQEPSHRYLRARLGMKWFEWWHRETLEEQAVLKAATDAVQDPAQAVSWGATDLEVSDEELLARRAIWRPLEARRAQLQEESNARWRAAYDEFERQNPEPKRGDS
jgi:hypothetical protein